MSPALSHGSFVTILTLALRVLGTDSDNKKFCPTKFELSESDFDF